MIGAPSPMDSDWRFGPYLLRPRGKQLLREGEPFTIGDRAFDLLVALVSRHGQVVSKRELLAAAWSGLVVEESNLRVQIGALRKLLDPAQPERYIRNVTGRGYCFIAEDVAQLMSPATTPPVSESPVRNGAAPGLPLSLHPLIGRELHLRQLLSMVEARRLVTLVGPGGIGKTSLALEAARALAERFAGEVRLVSLAALTDPRLVASACCSALGIPVLGDDARERLLAELLERRLLLVLDNCEHLIDAVAWLAESLLKSAPQVQVLATSREALRAEGEWVIRLPGLESPPGDAVLPATAIGRYSAVALFIERARAQGGALPATDEDWQRVAELCRRLDGIPLAIELAAARTDQFDLAELAAGLADRFELLTQGRRTALPRQQTLRAALDWSYALLDGPQQRLLTRLSIFRAGFRLDDAVEVCAGEGLGAAEIRAQLPQLAAKSLLSPVPGTQPAAYRLLETTRFYAEERLAQQSEESLLGERHARHLLSLLAGAEREWPHEPAARWIARYGDRIDDLRAALDRCFAHTGLALGRALLIASAPLWIRLALMQEFRDYLERALRGSPEAETWEPRAEMQLENLLGMAIWQTRLGPEMTAAFRRALSLAEQLGDLDAQIDALRGMFVERSASGDYDAAQDVALRVEAIYRSSGLEAHDLLRLTTHALAHHWNGDQIAAWACASALPAHPQFDARRDRSASICGYGISARWAYARIAWLAGFPGCAVQATVSLLDLAQQQDDPNSLFLALAGGACHVATWSGDRALAQRCLDLLRRYARFYSLEYWRSWQRSFEMVLGIDTLSRQCAEAEFPIADVEMQFGPSQREVIATMNPKMVGPWVLQRVRERPQVWCAAEVQRVAAQRQAAAGDRPGAEARLDAALELALQQGARSWALRIAMTRLRLAEDATRRQLASAQLGSVYAGFQDGFDTADLSGARQLLQIG